MTSANEWKERKNIKLLLFEYVAEVVFSANKTVLFFKIFRENISFQRQ